MSKSEQTISDEAIIHWGEMTFRDDALGSSEFDATYPQEHLGAEWTYVGDFCLDYGGATTCHHICRYWSGESCEPDRAPTLDGVYLRYSCNNLRHPNGTELDEAPTVPGSPLCTPTSVPEE